MTLVRAGERSYVHGVFDGSEIKLPDALEAGVYANSAVIWHTPSEFTLDFVTTPLSRDLDVGRIVSRVKIPTTFMFELIRRLNNDMTTYEREHGEIPQVGPPGEEDDGR